MSTEILGRWTQWREKLILKLRVKDVPGAEIGDILTEVAAHVDETGETPEEAFGDPVRYARLRMETATTIGSRSSSWKTSAIIAGAGLGSWLAASGSWELGAGDARWGPLPTWLSFIAGICLLAATFAFIKPDLIEDPRTGKPLVGSGRGAWLIIAAFFATAFALLGLAGWYFTR